MEKNTDYLKNAAGHFRTITRHKLTVMDLCFKVGMIRQGLLHDLSKYSPAEFLTGVRYYRGDRSPNAVEKAEKGYSAAWLHHKGRNRHHFEYWLDLEYNGDGVRGARMPLEYVLEMVCDRIAACKIYQGDAYTDHSPWEYYKGRTRATDTALHPDTKALLEEILMLLDQKGEKKALAYMRWLLKNPGRRY